MTEIVSAEAPKTAIYTVINTPYFIFLYVLINVDIILAVTAVKTNSTNNVETNS